MPLRFTALVLAVIIGGPLCCCGWVHGPAASAKVEEESCCHVKAKARPDAPKDKGCLCARTPKVRDIVQTGITIPQPEVSNLDTNPWVVVELPLPQSLKELAAIVLPEHGPPRSAVPLYHRHHALLI